MIKKAISLGIVCLFVIGGLIGIFFVVPDEVEGPGPTFVSGIISTDTTWTVADGPYIVTGNTSIDPNVNLTIEPGVNVKFDMYKYIRVNGTLYAVGNETQMIIFTSNEATPAPGDWGGLRIENPGNNSILKYCKIEYGGGKYFNGHYYGGGIFNEQNDLEISYCIFENNTAENGGGVFNFGSVDIKFSTFLYNIATVGAGAITNRGNIVVEHSLISMNTGAGCGAIVNDVGSALVNNCTITENDGASRGGGIFSYDGPMLVSNSTIIGNSASQGGGGIYNADGGDLTIEYVTISENDAPKGGGIWNLGLLNIRTSIISNNFNFGIEGDSFWGETYINNCSILNNTGGGIKDNPIELTYTNLDNPGYNIYVISSPDVYAPNNWWGTINTDLINQSIHDFYDDFSLGKVIYLPFQNSPINGGEGGLQSGAPWPMFGGNVRHTGLSPYDTSGNTGSLEWRFYTGNFITMGNIASTPVIDADGTIYIGSEDGVLYAINSDGTEKWNFTTSSNLYTTPAIGYDGIIYVSTDDNLFAINPNGTEKWQYTTLGNPGSSPVIGSDGTIYMGADSKLFAFNPNGTVKWSFFIGYANSSPAIGSDGTIYMGSYDHNLYAIYPNGTKKWSFLTGDVIPYSSPAIASDGTIYIGSQDNKLYAINPNGTEKWSFTTGYGVTSSPSIGSDGSVYFGSDDDILYAVYPNGTEKWNFITSGDVWSSPAIGSDGTIYFGSEDKNIYAVKSDGTLKWNYPTGGHFRSSPAIGVDGTIYIWSYDFYLYAIGGGSNQPPLTPLIPTGPTAGETNTSHSFSTSTTDPDGDQIKYGWDWDGDGTVDEWSALVDSGIEDNRSHSWSTPGIYNVKVKAQDEHGAESSWSNVLTLTISSPPPNQPPNTPSKPTGPTDGITNTSYIFNTTTTDPDDDQIKYGWDWDGDGTVDEWSGLVDSGIVESRSHNWSLPDIFSIKVKAQDEYGAESGWSSILVINISNPPIPPVNQPPIIPYPLGPTTGITNTTYSFETSSFDPEGDWMKYGWDWDGDGTVDEWSIYVPFTTEDYRSHNWSEPGIYNISVKVQDEHGAESGWSDPLTITITFDPDNDGDGIPDSEDPDDDNDGYNDDIDLFPFDPTEWLDTDQDGIGNNEDTDDDGDLVSDDIDAFPLDHLEWLDTDSDGIGNNADPDDDNDGYNDENDHFPLDPTRWDPLTEITISNMTVSNDSPTEGDEITINVDIQNSDSRENYIIVKFYLGNPNLGGTQIGPSQEVTIGSESLISISQNWIATSGNQTLYVVIGHNETTETITSSITIEVSEELIPQLVLSVGDINMYRFEPGEERTIFVEVTCYYQTLENVHLVVLDDQNLTIDHTITPPRTMLDGETTKFYMRITAPQLPDGTEKLEWDITIQAQGDNGISSNSEELDIVVSQNAVSFFNPVILAGAVATGSLATLGLAAAASRRNENWKYLLLLSLAVPLYTRIHGKKTLDNFVRGQVFGHIQSEPGTHFNEIKKTLQLGNGNLAYHLQKLEKEGFVKSKRDKRYRRFYPVGVVVPEEDGIKLSKTQETMLDHIERHPHSTQKEIAENLKESQQTISYNINVLVREGFMQEEKIKGIKKYTLIDENS